jgi:hypothetical protein
MTSLAVQDIKSRTLAGISNGFGRLICVASTRDYNTGQYHHEGLVSRFSSDVAAAALAECHREIFQELVRGSLADLVRELEEYVISTGICRDDVFLEYQSRLGSLALSPAALFAGSAILIATAVTRPMTSASDS